MSLCEFTPHGNQCPNIASVTVTLTAPDQRWEVPTCDEHVDDWVDEVAATARPITPPQ